MRNPLAVGIWLLRFCAAVLAAIWFYQENAVAAMPHFKSVHHAVDQVSSGAFFLLSGLLLVLFGMTGRRSRAD